MKSALLRNLLHEILRRSGRRLVRVRSGVVTGLHLEEDLRILIGSDCPLCLDIGANEGQTIRLLQRVFARPRIHAFEPSSQVFPKLERSHFRSGVTLHQCALGSHSARREFINYRKSVLSSFLPLDRNDGNRFREVDVAGTETVDVMTVDDFVAKNRLGRIDLLKVDTQGFDLEVLQGSSDALRRGIVDHVLVELNFVRLYEGQGSAQEINDYLAAHGFVLIDYYEKARNQHELAWCTALFGRKRKGLEAIA